MKLDVLTMADLMEFKKELLKDFKALLPKEQKAGPRLLKSREVCKLLRMSPGRLKMLRDEGHIKFIQLNGGPILYQLSDVHDFIVKNVKYRKAATWLLFLFSFYGL